MSPLPRAARGAVDRGYELNSRPYKIRYSDFFAYVDTVREGYARILGVSPDEVRAVRRSGNSREARAQRLVAAGFDPTTADWILTRESELQMQALRSRYEASRNGSTIDFYRQSSELRTQLRQELGDARFERYLKANGESLHVTIGTVLDSSPAQSVGLRVGDRIVSYGGERVYSMTDLVQQIMHGLPEEQVVIEFLRDDMPMQVVLPRGPVGISGGR